MRPLIDKKPPAIRRPYQRGEAFERHSPARRARVLLDELDRLHYDLARIADALLDAAQDSGYGLPHYVTEAGHGLAAVCDALMAHNAAKRP